MVENLLQDDTVPSQRELGERLRKFIRPDAAKGGINLDMLASGFEPRPPQIDVLDAATQALLENRGSGQFIKPPRTGKTVMFGSICKALDLKTLVLVPSKDLVDQTYDKFKNVVGIPAHKLGRLHSDVTDFIERDDAIDRDVLITTYATFRNLVAQGLVSPQNRPFIIADEVHRASGEVTGPIMRYWMDQGGLVQGWTATDMFADGSTVSESLFDGAPPIHETSFHEAAKNGEIAPTRNIVKETDCELKVKLSSVSGAEDISEREASMIVKQNGRDEAAIQDVMNSVDTVQFPDGKVIESHFCNLSQIWYCAGIDHAEKVANDLNAAFKQFKTADNVHRMVGDGKDLRHRYAAVISGNTPVKDKKDSRGNVVELGRESLLKAYEEGTIRCLVSADLLVEGYDFPHCEMTVMLRPTSSPRIAVQAGARSTGLNPKDKYKVGYVVSFVDKGVEGAAIFGEVVGGLWHAPENMQHIEFKPTTEKRVKPNRSDLPSITTHYTTREWINFNERRKGVKVLQKELPPGHVEAFSFLRRPDYRQFVNFDGKLELLFQEFERQYNEAQEALPNEERFKQPFMTKQGVEVTMGTNVSGGHTLLVHKDQMEHYVHYELMPDPLLAPPPEKFVYFRDIIKDYHLLQSDYPRIEAFEQRIAQEYQQAQKSLAPNERHQEPVTSEHGVPIIKARRGRQNVMAYDETKLREYLEDKLHLVMRAPPQKRGFLNATQVKWRLGTQRYSVGETQIERWFQHLQQGYDAHMRESGLRLGEADVWVNPEGIALSIARTTNGNQLVASVVDSIESPGTKDVLAAAVEHLRLVQKLPLLKPLPKDLAGKYIPFDRVIQDITKKYGEEWATKLVAYRDVLENAYDKSQAARPAAKQHTPMHTKNGIHFVKARDGEKGTNAFFLRHRDINLILRHLGIEDACDPAPPDYISYEAAVEELKLAGLSDFGLTHTLLQLVDLEYEEAQKALPISKRHSEPFTSSDGIRTVRASTKDGNRQMFHKADLLAKAPAALGITTLEIEFDKEETPGEKGFPMPTLKVVDRVTRAPETESHEPPLQTDSGPPNEDTVNTPERGIEEKPTNTVTNITPLKRYLVAMEQVPDLQIHHSEEGEKHTIRVTSMGTRLPGYPKEITIKSGRSQKPAEQWAKQILDEAATRYHTDFLQ